MSQNLVSYWIFTCDGGAFGCRAFFEGDDCDTLRGNRKAARKAGWRAGVQGPYHVRGDRLLDYCPDHRGWGQR